jgi:hypothetical protein
VSFRHLAYTHTHTTEISLLTEYFVLEYPY